MDTSLEQQLSDAGYPGKFDLSSLIEACGDGYFTLSSHQSGWQAKRGLEDKWINGSTPEEAVAKLWLELNKKV